MFDFNDEFSYNDPDPINNFDLALDNPFENSIFASEDETLADNNTRLIEEPKPQSPSTKPSKPQRGKKVDDFDYKSFINSELQRIDADFIDEAAKKKLIQKIRNRVSAQRSRVRVKGAMELLKDDNSYLLAENAELKRKIIDLNHENDDLKTRLTQLEKSYKSHSTTEYEETQSVESFELHRTSYQAKSQIMKTGLFIVTLCVLVAFSPTDRSVNVKLGGVVPLLASSPATSSKQLQTLENYCKSYCSEKLKCSQPKPSLYLSGDTSTDLQVYDESTKILKVFQTDQDAQDIVPLMCYPYQDAEGLKKTTIFVKKGFVEKLMEPGCHFYVPEILSLKLN